jgi:hypothetical protein
MSQYLKVDSSLRQNRTTTSASDCLIPSNEVLTGTYILKSAMIPITYFNINSTNSSIYWTDTIPRTCQIPSGFYNSYSVFATAVAMAMTANGGGTVTCSVNSLTNILTVNNTTTFAFAFATNTTNSAAEVMGFTEMDSISDTSQVGTKVINLLSTSFYNFSISEASIGMKTLSGQQYTFSIPALTTTPGQAYYEPSEQFPIQIRLNATKTLTVKIYDDRGRILNNMYSDWNMIIEKKSYNSTVCFGSESSHN